MPITQFTQFTQSETLGLYLHIPFCESKCAYCDFYSLPYAQLSGAEKYMDDYTNAFTRHFKQFADNYINNNININYIIDTVYFGGGTPSFIGAARLLKIWRAVQEYYKISPGAEITLEANPDSITRNPDLLYILHDAGFNRVSLGMQSANDQELQIIGRVHEFQQVQESVKIARDAGFDNISLDLIYGLPNQTMQSWRDTLHAAINLNPEHLSCYGLKIEPGTPLYKNQERYNIPDDDQQAEFYLYAVKFLKKYDYNQYEISNFARPGRESRHNLKYWNLNSYLGFGPGAHSDFNQIRFAWARDLSQYIQAIENNQEPPLSEKNQISQPERVREKIMLNLRTVYGLNPADYRQDFHFNFNKLQSFLNQCVQAGYAYWHDGRFCLTPYGFLLSNQIIGQIWELLPNI